MTRIWGEQHSIQVGWAGIEIFYNNGGKNGGKVFGGHGIRFNSTSKSSLASGPLQSATSYCIFLYLNTFCFVLSGFVNNSFNRYHQSIKEKNISFTKLGNEECETCLVHGVHLKENVSCREGESIDCQICNKQPGHAKNAMDIRKLYQ